MWREELGYRAGDVTTSVRPQPRLGDESSTFFAFSEKPDKLVAHISGNFPTRLSCQCFFFGLPRLPGVLPPLKMSLRVEFHFGYEEAGGIFPPSSQGEAESRSSLARAQESHDADASLSCSRS